MATTTVVPHNYTFHEKLDENHFHMNFVIKYLEYKGLVVSRAVHDNEYGLPVDDSIDFVLKGKKYQFIADNRIGATGNVAVELIGQSEQPKFGWLFTSQADVLMYYDTVNKNAHIFKLPALKEGYINYNRAKLPMSHVTTPYNDKRKGYFADCVLVPLKDLKGWPGIDYRIVSLAGFTAV